MAAARRPRGSSVPLDLILRKVSAAAVAAVSLSACAVISCAFNICPITSLLLALCCSRYSNKLSDLLARPPKGSQDSEWLLKPDCPWCACSALPSSCGCMSSSPLPPQVHSSLHSLAPLQRGQPLLMGSCQCQQFLLKTVTHSPLVQLLCPSHLQTSSLLELWNHISSGTQLMSLHIGSSQQHHTCSPPPSPSLAVCSQHAPSLAWQGGSRAGPAQRDLCSHSVTP
jgi:hypothetical protein